MSEEATTAAEKISLEDCERLIGHCWVAGVSQLWADGFREQWCQHCGATRKQTLSDWVTSPPEPRDGGS